MKTKQVHISMIRQNDAILCLDGFTRTIGNKDIKNGFLGTSIWGDSYKLGTIPVTVVVYPRWSEGKELN